MKRFISSALALAMVTSVAPVSAMAVNYPDVYDVSFVADDQVVAANHDLWYIDSIQAPEYEGVEKWYSDEVDMYLNPGDRVWGDEFGTVATVVFNPYVEAPVTPEVPEAPALPEVYDVSFVVGDQVVAANHSLPYYSSIQAPVYEGVEKWYSDEVDMYLNPGESVWADMFDTVATVVFTPYSQTPVTPEVPDVPEVPEANLAKAEIVDLGWAKFLTVAFNEGYSMDNCVLTVDGVAINDAVTPVTTDGSIVKWEITSLAHGELGITVGDQKQTIALNGTGDSVEVLSAQTPDYFLMNGPIYVWDYHLTNYDDEGNIRYAPAQTTVGLDAVSGATAYSRDAIVYEDENALPYFVKGEVNLEFNYKTAEEKAYVDGITDVDLVSANEYKETLNDELHYTLTKDIANGEHVNALITVPIGQVNFTSNGRYNLRVTSNGQAQLFPIHLVAETVPSMTVTGDQGYYGNEVHLRIADMTYGITRPVYRVDLTNPDGMTETLLKFDDWFLHGDLLVLYNSITNHFRETGSYTVTVYADGFQTFSHTFWQEGIADRDPDAEAAPVAMAAEPMTYDAISTASVGGGGSSDGGSDGGDSKVMNANLIIDSDLIANAKLALAMGVEDEAAQGISDRWDTMTKLYAFNQGADPVYDYDAYCDAVNAAEGQGDYLTFAEYIATEGAVTTPNRPYAVKQVLEDNLLGETTGFIEAVGLMIPGYTVELVDDTAVITFEDDADYMAAVAAGQLTLNGNSVGLQAGKDYVLEGNVLTLKNVDYGVNLLSIRTETYETARVEIERIYPVEPVELSAEDVTKGEEIVVKCTAIHENGKCDFLDHVTGVQIIAPNGYRDDVMADGVESVFEKIGYTVDTKLNVLVIGKDTLLQDCFLNEDGTFAAGEYQIVITAEYYGDKVVTVNVADAQIEGTNVTPTVAGVEYNAPAFGDKFYRVSFLEEDVAAYLNAITSITLDGAEAKKVASFWNDTNAYKFAKDEAQGGADKFIDFTADCFADKTVEVVIHAEGYADLTFKVVNGKFELVLTKAPEVADVVREGGVMGQYDRVSFVDDVTDYLPAITSVTLNGKEAMKVTNLFNETNAYKFSNDDAQGGADKFIDFTTDCFAGTVEVVVTATGYEPLTFTVVDGKLAGTDPNPNPDPEGPVEPETAVAPIVKAVTEAGGILGKTYEVSFEAFEGITNYLNAVTTITLNNVEAKKVINLFGESKAYKLAVADDSQSASAYDIVEFTADSFAGTVEVVVTATGYEPLTFTVVDGKLAGAEPEGPVDPNPNPNPDPDPNPDPEGPVEPETPATPAVKDVKQAGSFLGKYYTVSFDADVTAASAYLNAITSITVDGVAAKKVNSFWNDTNSYKFSNDSAFGGADQFIDFTADCYGKTVVITAEGYADLTFKLA